jgi:hypothetical protein
MAAARENLKSDLAAAVAAQPLFPAGRFAGRGIVICAGGARLFTCAWVCIGLLRRRLGCTLPIEVWHLGADEMGPPMRALLRELGAQPVDALEVAKRHQVERLGGWELKSYALLHSRFREVLLLDADNVAVKNPAFLFERQEFQETGAMFWPDLVRIAHDNPIWTLSGLAWQDTPAFESGQLLLDKARSWRALCLANWINQRSADFYDLLYGDKDTFLLAWRLLGQPFHLVRHKPKLLEYTLCQRDPDGALLFQHRNIAKWILKGENPRVEGFRMEDECLGLLEELAELWDGRVYNPPPRSTQAQAIEQKLIRTQEFRFIRVSSDERALQLLPDHRIREGASKSEFYWHVEDGAHGPELIFESDGYRSCALQCSVDGIWRGKALAPPGMPIELQPINHADDARRPALTRDSNPAPQDQAEWNALTALLDRILEAYALLPLDAETKRDLVGAIRTLAALDPDLCRRLRHELADRRASASRAEILALALAGLADAAHRPDGGGVAAGHSGMDQEFTGKGYERIA